jgi:hypothetical protein
MDCSCLGSTEQNSCITGHLNIGWRRQNKEQIAEYVEDIDSDLNKIKCLYYTWVYLEEVLAGSILPAVKTLVHLPKNDGWNAETCRSKVKRIIIKLGTVYVVSSYFSDWWRNNARN